MHPTKIAAFSLLALLVACGGSSDSDQTFDGPTLGADPEGAPMGPHGKPEEPPILGAHAAKGSSPFGGGSSPLLTWHSGIVMNNSAVQPIFWGPKWNDPTFAKDKIDGLDRFYAGLSDTKYAATNTEYTGSGATKVGTSVTPIAHAPIDPSAAPSRAPKTSAILAEVCKVITNPRTNGYYPVYTDTPRGSAGYCAWHSYGTCNGVDVQFAFFFNLDGDSGCDPQDTKSTHSQGLAALANVSGHEWSEMVTDPRNGGWWDSSGNENSDKCAWTFSDNLVPLGTEGWKIQGNWSNVAYKAGAGNGYDPKAKAVRIGCIDGN